MGWEKMIAVLLLNEITLYNFVKHWYNMENNFSLKCLIVKVNFPGILVLSIRITELLELSIQCYDIMNDVLILNLS